MCALIVAAAALPTHSIRHAADADADENDVADQRGPLICLTSTTQCLRVDCERGLLRDLSACCDMMCGKTVLVPQGRGGLSGGSDLKFNGQKAKTADCSR